MYASSAISAAPVANVKHQSGLNYNKPSHDISGAFGLLSESNNSLFQDPIPLGYALPGVDLSVKSCEGMLGGEECEVLNLNNVQAIIGGRTTGVEDRSGNRCVRFKNEQVYPYTGLDYFDKRLLEID